MDLLQYPVSLLFRPALRISILVLIISIFTPLTKAQVQIYPVSVTTQLTPPYSVNLADYTAPGSEQLRVIIVQRDLTQAPYRLFLKMNIELNGRTIIRSAPLYVPPPLTLDPGIPTIFSGTDLSPFFDPENMDFVGYSRDAYMRSKLLPEGAYVITFTAYDWTRRDVALSNGGSFFCYLAKADPPLLNLPVNNAVVPVSTPQYINFQWLSRTASSPNSANSTRYRFELFEMRTGGISPGEIVQASRPVFTAETERTSLIYSIAEPSLEKGLRYVWRVRATDIQGRDYIRNNGLSEVFSFIYGMEGNGVIDLGNIENFSARAVTPRKAGLSWDASEYDSYKIFYRKKGDENKWYESETIQNKAELKGLSPGTIYECRVQGKKGSVWGNVSSTDTVSMPLPPVIECGSPFTPLMVSNNEPLGELMRLQQFDAGGFMVTLTDPYAITIKPGVFSGKGFVEVPLFSHKKIRCEFRDIFINTDYQMVRGQIRLITDNSEDGDNALWSLDDVFEGGTDNGTVKSGAEEASVILPETVISKPENIVLDIAGKEILVINESSDTVHIDVSEKLEENPGSLTVKDSDGNLYSVDTKTGMTTPLGKAPAPGSVQQIATIPSVLDNRKGIVSFDVVPGLTKFDFDKRDTKYTRSNLFNEEYRTIKLNDGSLYDIPFKLIPVGETDVVSAKVEVKGKKISPDSIVFRSGTGTIYKPVRVNMDKDGRNAEYQLTLPSGKDNDGIEIYATWTDSKRQTFVLGKMIVMSYSVKKPKLTLVPVNGNGVNIDINVIKKELDRIYLPVAVDWQVSLDEDFNVTIDSLNITGSGLFSKYTDEMKQLNTSFIIHKEAAFDPSTVYLFMLQFSENQSATGDMPKGTQFGYIFSRTAGDDGAIYRTIAHEIAHGTFSLNHTFDTKYDIAQGTTNNLLDYTAGTDLVKHQWDAIHDPGLVIGMFERDEDGMSYNVTFAESWIQNINNIACAKKNSQLQVGLKEISPGLSGSFEYGSIGKIGLEIPELTASISDNAINLLSQEVSDYTDYKDGKKYVQVVYNSFSGKYRVFFKIAPEKKNDFLNIVNTPSSAFFTNLSNNIPSKESNAAYSKLAQLPVCSYEEIVIANRIKYFEWLSGENWTNEDQEIILLDLLTHVKDRKELYNELYKRPMLLAKMMLSCDGDNRQMFINEITKLCDESWASGAAKGDVYIGTVPSSFGTFYSGNAFITYAILSEGNNNCSVSNYIGRFPNGMFDWGNVQMLREFGNFSCNLLDPVEIISSDGSQGLFPLIYPVNLSQQHGIQQVGQQFAATLNYIGVASSVRLLATGSKLAKSIAFIELTKTGVDAIFNDPQVIQILSQTEGGKNFLKYWQIASVTVDIATIGVDVLENIAKHGPEASKALKVAGKNDAADYVDDIVTEATTIKAVNSNYLSNLPRYKQLFQQGKISELFSELKKTTAFPKMGNTRVRNELDLLAEYKAKYGQDASNFPYSTNNAVTDFELAETGYFVRMFSGNSANSSWIFRIEDLREYKNIDEIVEKLALPSKPTKVGLVEIPEGVKLRKSAAGPQNWANGTTPKGGGIQYEIIGDRKNEWFKPLFDNIDDFYK